MQEFPQITFSPEARDLFCQATGVSPEQADASMTRENAERRVRWQAYLANHPGADLKDFARDDLVATLAEMSVTLGVPVSMARRHAKQILRARGF